MGFTAGQQAYSDFFELTGKEDVVANLQVSTHETEDVTQCSRQHSSEGYSRALALIACQQVVLALHAVAVDTIVFNVYAICLLTRL